MLHYSKITSVLEATTVGREYCQRAVAEDNQASAGRYLFGVCFYLVMSVLWVISIWSQQNSYNVITSVIHGLLCFTYEGAVSRVNDVWNSFINSFIATEIYFRQFVQIDHFSNQLKQ